MLIFHQFTWQQFLVAAVIFTGLWYAALALFCYRREVTDFLSGKRKAPERLKKEWEEELEGYPDEEDGLMGAAAMDEGISAVSMSEFSFAGRDNQLREESYPFPDREELQGLIPDVLEELKLVFHANESANWNVDDLKSELQRALAKYPRLKQSPHRDALNDWIKENSPVAISDEELDQLWL